VKNGKVGAPVGEMNAPGNLVDLFAHLVEVGNDPWPYSSTLSPTLVFDAVSFSGA
jgi:PmbA protein